LIWKFFYIVEDKGIELAAMKVELIEVTEDKENLKNQHLQEIETNRSNYTQTIEKLNFDIDALKAEILVKNEEISSVENKSSQLGTDYQTKLAEIEQNKQMSIDENIVKLQAEISRLNQDLIEKENFVKEAESANQDYETRINVSISL
jgi:chromosome segregation ATPase